MGRRIGGNENIWRSINSSFGLGISDCVWETVHCSVESMIGLTGFVEYLVLLSVCFEVGSLIVYSEPRLD